MWTFYNLTLPQLVFSMDSHMCSIDLWIYNYFCFSCFSIKDKVALSSVNLSIFFFLFSISDYFNIWRLQISCHWHRKYSWNNDMFNLNNHPKLGIYSKLDVSFNNIFIINAMFMSYQRAIQYLPYNMVNYLFTKCKFNSFYNALYAYLDA